MQKLWFLLFSITTLTFIACESEQHHDDDIDSLTFEYSLNIISPSVDDKKVDDSIHLHVNFDEAHGETVHHINVKIYEAGNPENVIFNGPDDAHVHNESGHHEFQSDFILSNENGINEHTDWVMEARVWGHEDGLNEQQTSQQFHVHPN